MLGIKTERERGRERQREEIERERERTQSAPTQPHMAMAGVYTQCGWSWGAYC